MLHRLSKIGSREPGLPPGPPTLPLIGNLHQFETKHTYRKFTEWAKTYGDIYSIKMGSTTGIVISSPKLAREYIDLRGATTSDRPPVYTDELISGGLELPLSPYGPTWRSMRRAAHDMLSPKACLRHLPIQRAESAQLMFDLLESPQRFYTHTSRYSGSVITSVLYGIHSPVYENGLVEKFDKFTERLESALKPGNSPPVDMYPFMKYLPEILGPTPWKTRCKEVRKEQREIFFGLLDLVVERMEKNQRNGCFIESVLDRQEQYGLDRELIGYLGGSLLQAGNDTTAVFLQTLLVCIISHPAVQRRAQQEIDSVIGPDRLPEFSDFDNLPYLKAVINEVHRFRPIVPITIPHASTADERAGDYMIPKGSILFINAWGIYRHEDYYENPDTFDPDRFLKNPHGTKPGVDPTGCRGDYAFGAGRVCPGVLLLAICWLTDCAFDAV
ncbi:unnamed protein product [Somion occarium]|uniref:Cytochrome P450 n=1 Tax=Somion occarium TaxID=3059160 RepID=A0ABP1DJ78_9APHY